MEQTSKNQTLNIPNLRGSNFEHIRTSHLGPKPNFEPLEHHQKPNCSRTLLIKNGPNFFQNHQNRTSNMSKHVILAKNWTSNLPNITENRTVCEHQTACSTSSIVFIVYLGGNSPDDAQKAPNFVNECLLRNTYYYEVVEWWLVGLILSFYI